MRWGNDTDEDTGRVAISRWRVVAFVVLATACLAYWIANQPPFRAPNYVVRIESAEQSKFRPGVRCVVSDPVRQPDRRLWVEISTDTTVWDRTGGSGNVAVGQTISVWTNGVEAATAPPIAYATFVRIDATGDQP